MEIWTTVILIFLLLLFILFSRKGSLIYELLSLPYYWYQMGQVNTSSVQFKKVKFGSHRRQYLLYCTPKERTVDRPVSIVYHHGGGWRFGTPEKFLPNAKVFTDLGFTVLMPSYRRIPFYRYDAIREDLILGLKKGIELLKDQGQPTDLLLSGMSAGGNVVSLLALDQQTLIQHQLDPQMIKGLLLFGAPTAMEKMPFSLVVLAYAGRRNSDMFRRANPITYCNQPIEFPVLAVHGKQDGMVPFSVFEKFSRALKEIDADSQIYILDNGSHLDAGRWAYQKEEVNTRIEDWVNEYFRAK